MLKKESGKRKKMPARGRWVVVLAAKGTEGQWVKQGLEIMGLKAFRAGQH